MFITEIIPLECNWALVCQNVVQMYNQEIRSIPSNNQSYSFNV